MRRLPNNYGIIFKEGSSPGSSSSPWRPSLPFDWVVRAPGSGSFSLVLLIGLGFLPEPLFDQPQWCQYHMGTILFHRVFIKIKWVNTCKAFRTVLGHSVMLTFSFFKLIYFNWRLATLQYCGGFCYTSTWISHGGTCVPPSWTHLPLPSTLLPPLSPPHPSGLSQSTGFECPASCIELALVICFTYGNIHVSMLFSQIIPPSPSPTESKRLFYTSVSLLLSHIQGYRYHLSKFHIYALIYCIGVSLSDLLHSV